MVLMMWKGDQKQGRQFAGMQAIWLERGWYGKERVEEES